VPWLLLVEGGMGLNNMATDTRSNNGKDGPSFSRVMQKHAGRAKEKILQNLGKADKTTDEVFDQYEANFNKQQTSANKLHREVSNYIRCARALQGASKSLFETLQEVYEPDWAGFEHIYTQSQSSDILWTDFVHKLQEQTMAPLHQYQAQFPELRKKIDKRGRKLVDYDSMRHQVEALQKSNKRDEYKMARCKDQLESARTTYDALNKELYTSLPTVYDERVHRTASSISTLFSAESALMREGVKISNELESIGEKLTTEEQRGTYKTKRGQPVTLNPVNFAATPQATINNVPHREEVGRPYEEIQFEDSKKQQLNGIPDTKIPAGVNTAGLAEGVLYQVRSTYKYEREDTDELSFDVGEVINVVEYEDPEDMEDGWLCGYITNPNEKGLFPGNFTKNI